jgi:methylthioribose-1-phosphate isomerase
MEILETVRWREGKVRILDQTLLPEREVYSDLETVEEIIQAIATLAVRGAPAIGVAGAYGVALAAAEIAARCEPGLPPEPADFAESLARRAELIAKARPTAVNLQWACDRVMKAVREAGAGVSSARVALTEADRILAEDLALSRRMASHGATLLPEKGRVVSHCNTGGLATGGGGTALSLVFEAVAQGKEIFVHVDETRPLLQGARLTAWELARAGIPYAVQCDGAAAWLMKTHRIDAVLVGADRIAANGDTANKIGTLHLALAAREYGVPFYVVAPSSSFDGSLASGDLIPIEERPEHEVLSWAGRSVTPAGARAWNPAFDVTPARLITAWVSEEGVERRT